MKQAKLVLLVLLAIVGVLGLSYLGMWLHFKLAAFLGFL